MPARQSRTGTWLVSPAAGCEKKKIDASTTGPQTTKLSILEHIVVYTDSVGSGLAPRGTIKHQKPGEITKGYAQKKTRISSCFSRLRIVGPSPLLPNLEI